MHIYSIFYPFPHPQLSISLSPLKKESLLYINILFYTASLKRPVMHSDFQDLSSSLGCESSQSGEKHFHSLKERKSEMGKKKRQERKSLIPVLI